MNESIAIVGRTNVGKSLLFNKLTKARKALVINYHGVTRDVNSGYIELNGKTIYIEDTGGIPEEADQFSQLIINKVLKSIAKQNDIKLQEGIYAGVFGPQLETRAEYRMLQILEVDAVGMSTVPEVIVAKHLNLTCAAISVLTYECDPKNLAPVTIKEIIKIAGKAEPKMIILFKELIKQLWVT